MAGDLWSKWFWKDWENDKALHLCSLSARGLWKDMLCIMHESSPRGFLKVDDEPVTMEELASLVRAPLSDVEIAFAELEKRKVFSKNKDEIPYCRRMTREEKKAKVARQNGSKGGRPSNSKTTDISPSVTKTETKTEPMPKPNTEPNPNPEQKQNESPKKQEAIEAEERKEKNTKKETSDFQAFYQAYPRKVARGAAEKAYDKAIKKISPDNLLAAAERYAKEREGQDPSFTPHASTWLNQERWADIPEQFKRQETSGGYTPMVAGVG